MTTTEIVPVLIVAKPGPLRESLQILLTSMPQIKSVGEANDAAAALDLLARTDPGLVLLDTDLPNDDAWALLSQIQVQWPQVRCLVLADSCPHQERAAEVGVCVVVPKGAPPARLAQVIEVLLLGGAEPVRLGERGSEAAETEGPYACGSGGTA